MKLQSRKQGILVIVDAADNAQLEAEFRHEDAFPRLLLASVTSEPIDGIKLVLTARPHRMAGVIGQSKVVPFGLAPFTEPETRTFLAARRDNLSSLEFGTAWSRSKGNARVLDYLLETWDQNVVASVSTTEIKVDEIITQRCQKIFDDLHLAGWKESEVREFFAGISLLPPPIPLDDLAGALGWSTSQVSSAASDLAPMLELLPHGVIFRDEPTETYVRETYSRAVDAQQAIAQRLQDAQTTSSYAAEALPYFLVVINDSNRAFALADSAYYPKSVQSDFGKRRLALARLHAAFRLAVKAGDLDRVLSLSMRLAQVVSANAKGDQFIRDEPALAVMLGDRDAYRRLFNDRAGWRGARSARLTVAHNFAGEEEEAAVQSSRTVGWINWYSQQEHEDDRHDRDKPGVSDFAAVMFQSALERNYDVVDRNLANWNRQFALSASAQLVALIVQYDRYAQDFVLRELAAFAASPKCQALALKVALLAKNRSLTAGELASIARSATAWTPEKSAPRHDSFDNDNLAERHAVQAGLSAVIHVSKASARRILSGIVSTRPSGHDYSERYGQSRVWTPILHACVNAWASGKSVQRSDLLPNEFRIGRHARSIKDAKALLEFVSTAQASRPANETRRRRKGKPKPEFDERRAREICVGIEMSIAMAQPIEEAILGGSGIGSKTIDEFLATWRTNLRTQVHYSAEEAKDLLGRTLGLGFAGVLLRHAHQVSPKQGEELVQLISTNRFFIGQKTTILALLAEHPAMADVCGRFAAHITDQIKSDDDIRQRGDAYSGLAAALLPMSLEEARAYYAQGLAELDQMGGGDYDQIYSLLHFAAQQEGGVVRQELGHRLMNLCQTIVHNEPSKFGWTLFAHAAARSVGLSAINKLIRWDDQDIADFSYGLPQLACFLVKFGALDPRRAAFLLTICEDHGWRDWQIGEGLTVLLQASAPRGRRALLDAVLGKLFVEHSDGEWTTAWESLLAAASTFPGLLTKDERAKLTELQAEATRSRDEYNARHSSPSTPFVQPNREKEKAEFDERVRKLVSACDPLSALAIDDALRKIREDQTLRHAAEAKFLDGLRAKVQYPQRLEFLSAVCEATEIEFSATVGIFEKAFEQWSASTAHLTDHSKDLVRRVFAFKGSELFDVSYSSLARHIKRLTDLCGDRALVLNCILETISQEKLELDGDEWLQIATALCEHATPKASLDALETLLSGQSLRIADDIGEGAFREEFRVASSEAKVFANLIWHLLGDYDGYKRWMLARGLKTLCDLGLFEDLSILVEGFDRQKVDSLVSTKAPLSFQNSQQWLLMGISRAAHFDRKSVEYLRPKLLDLAGRNDLHVVDKVHVVRALGNLGDGFPDSQAEAAALRASVWSPAAGYGEHSGFPPHKEPTSAFRFDYEFDKHRVSGLSRLFGISKADATNAIVAEITKRWPETNSFDDFPGHDRYRSDDEDRHEFYREHIQRHALLSAATTLSQSLPVATRDYETYDNETPWTAWLDDFDTTFDDGSWLADHKDRTPSAAKVSFLARTEGKKESLQEHSVLLSKVGLANFGAKSLVPIQGSWTSPDRVHVAIVTGLVPIRGAIGVCEKFSKREVHDLWLPQFWDEGRYHRRRYDANPFEPFVWSPNAYGVGIDVRDEIAARGAAARPQLGIDLTSRLGLQSDRYSGEWHTQSGRLALKSQVWGRWQPSDDSHRNDVQNEGELLFADQRWVAETTELLGRRLVFTVTFAKYPSSRQYDERSGAKAVFVGLWNPGAPLRLWHAKKASIQKPY